MHFSLPLNASVRITFWNPHVNEICSFALKFGQWLAFSEITFFRFNSIFVLILIQRCSETLHWNWMNIGQKLDWHKNNENMFENYLFPNIFSRRRVIIFFNPIFENFLKIVAEIKYGKTQTRFSTFRVRKLRNKLN